MSSPPACIEIWNLPPVMSLTLLAKASLVPKMVSSDFGKLEAQRQRTAAWACTAGAMPAARMPAMPAFLMRERRSIELSPGVHEMQRIQRNTQSAACDRVEDSSKLSTRELEGPTGCKNHLQRRCGGFPCGKPAYWTLTRVHRLTNCCN